MPHGTGNNLAVSTGGEIPPAERQALYEKFLALQQYVGWNEADHAALQSHRESIAEALPEIIDAFYLRVAACEATAKVMTGGEAQVARLKNSMRHSLLQVMDGPYDEQFVSSRWQIGRRHLQIGLDESFVCVAMSTIRAGMLAAIEADAANAKQAKHALSKLLDLDLALVQSAYDSQRLRLEREASQAQSEQRFRTLVESASTAVAIVSAKGQVLYFSPFAEAVSGYSLADVQGKPLQDLLVDDAQRARLTTSFLSALDANLNDPRQGDGVRDEEFRLLSADGSQRQWLCNITRLDDYEGERALIVVAHDTTQWNAAQERMQRAERLAGIGQMVAGLAHESRNALQRIGSMAEMLELELGDNSESLALVHRLKSAQDDLTRLFDELRNYAAPIKLDLAPCQVSHCWNEAWELTRTARHASGRIAEQMECESDEIVVDRFRLVQVLRNLFENSVAAGGDDVTIGVRLREANSTSVPSVELTVSDNGPGISQEHCEKIFQPFYTTRTKGSGLGLAIARRVVDAHGGIIVVDQPSNGGAAFTILLPKNPAV